MQAVRKHIKLSHILFFPFGLWRWGGEVTGQKIIILVTWLAARLGLAATATEIYDNESKTLGDSWELRTSRPAQTSRDNKNDADDEVNYYDISH